MEAESLPLLLKELKLPAFTRHYRPLGETARADVQTCIDDLLAREILLVDDKGE